MRYALAYNLLLLLKIKNYPNKDAFLLRNKNT